MLEKLKKYKQKYGMVSVTFKREVRDDAKLERWVDYQKRLLSQHEHSPGSTSLDNARIGKLQDIFTASI
jgi:hypothetical protein